MVSAIELVKQGVGVTLVPKTMLDKLPDLGLFAFDLDEPITRSLGLLLKVREADVENKNTIGFISAIKEEFRFPRSTT